MKLQLLIQEGKENQNGIIWPKGTLQSIINQINVISPKRRLALTTQKPPCDLTKVIGIVDSAEIIEGTIWITVELLQTHPGNSVKILLENKIDLKVDSVISTDMTNGQPSGKPKLLGLFIPL